MNNCDVFEHIIRDPNAPERLKGKSIKAILSDGHLSFVMQDAPDDITTQEMGYFKWFTGEMVDKIKDNLPPEIANSFNISEVSRDLNPEEQKALKDAMNGSCN